MIELKNLTKKYGELVAVNNVNLMIPAGKIFGFLGPNGAGKTTTIKMMTGLMKATSGSISIGGYDIEKEHLKAKKCFGYVPDKAFLYEKLTASEYLSFILNIFHCTTATIQQEIDEYLKQKSTMLVGKEYVMTGRAKFSQYSNGYEFNIITFEEVDPEKESRALIQQLNEG